MAGMGQFRTTTPSNSAVTDSELVLTVGPYRGQCWDICSELWPRSLRDFKIGSGG